MLKLKINEKKWDAVVLVLQSGLGKKRQQGKVGSSRSRRFGFFFTRNVE
jgi:hypothetical protein